MEDRVPRRRLPSREVKRLKTLRERYGQAKINEWAQKANAASTAKFNTASSQAANRARWAKYYAEHPEALEKKIAKEKKKRGET